MEARTDALCARAIRVRRELVMGERSRQWLRRGLAAAALLFGGAATAACNLVSGVDELTTGECKSVGELGCTDTGNRPREFGSHCSGG